MEQIVDLQQDPAFQTLGVALVSIATDSPEEQALAAQEYGITTPLLADTDKQVSAAYNVLQWAVPSGEPGHTFVLVDAAGTVAWIQDYGAPANGGLMYVPVDELTRQVQTQLGR
jgi:peroxiredoxin